MIISLPPLIHPIRCRFGSSTTFNVTCELTKEQLNNIPHYVYLASRQRTGELEFISRDIWIDKARERAKMYTWGGRQEQEELREMRNRRVPKVTGLEVV